MEEIFLTKLWFKDVGHIKTLQKAKELGTFLLVGIHDDEVDFNFIINLFYNLKTKLVDQWKKRFKFPYFEFTRESS